MGGLIIDGDAELVNMVDHRVLHLVRLLGEDQTAGIFHHVVGARPEEPGVGPALFAGHGILGLVAVAAQRRGGQNGNFLKMLPGQSVQAGFYPVSLQPGFLLIVHVPEVAAAAELGHGALTVHPMGGFFQQLGDFSRCPGFPHRFDAHQHPLSGNGIGDKHGNALNMGNPLPLCGVIRDNRLVNYILFQHFVSPYSGSSMPIFWGRKPHFS